MSIKHEHPEMYLQMLIAEREKLEPFFPVIPLTGQLLDNEIHKIQSGGSFDVSGDAQIFEADLYTGEPVRKTEKIFVPVSEHPTYNFVGRLLGPGGATLKRVESTCRCKILIRGEGSMKSKEDKEKKKGQPGNEHLSEPLHVLIMVNLPEKAADYCLGKAREAINALLVPPTAEELDSVKKNQLRDLERIKSTRSHDPYYGYSVPPDYYAAYGAAPPPPYYGNYPVGYTQFPPSSAPRSKRSRS